MIFYTENPKEATKKLLQQINELSKTGEYKTSIQKSIWFLYTCNEPPKNEIKKTISYTLTLKRIKYLGIN